MAKVLSESHFSRLVSATKRPIEDINEIVAALQSLRSSISLKWFEQFSDFEPVTSMVEVWRLLFHLSGHSEAIIRLNSYSCLGAIIVTIAPIFPKVISSSFSQAVLEIEVSPNVSIAIISCFTHLIHFIAPIEVNNFILNTPVLHHFGIDVSQYIQHLPHIVKLMGPLEKQFHQALLRSLLISFGRNPNHSFVEVANILISMNPKILIHDTLEFSRSNNLNQIILALGPEILQNPTIYNEVVSNNYLNDFLNMSLSVLETETQNLTDFERASSTLVLIARNSPEHLQKISEKCSKLTIPKHLRKFYVLLPVPKEELLPDEADPSSLACAKLRALKDFVIRNNNEEGKKFVIDILVETHKKATGDIFCAFCEAFGDPFNILFTISDENSKKQLGNILNSILNMDNLNWVQQDAIVKLFDVLDVNQAATAIDKYVPRAQKHLLECCFSSHESLSANAITVLTNFTTLLTIHQIVADIYKYDMFSIDVAFKILKLLNSLLAEFGISKPLKEIAPTVEEIIMLYEDPKIASEGFLYLARLKHESKSVPVIARAADWMNAIFASFTQREMQMAFDFNHLEIPNYLTLVETDLVANILPTTYEAVPGIINCFEYLINCKLINMQLINLMAYQILHLFPREVAALCMLKLDTSSQEFVNLASAILTIMNWTSSIDSAATCCDFIVQAPKVIVEGAAKNVSAILESGRVKTGDNLFRFYRILSLTDHNLAEDLCSRCKEQLPYGERVIFDLKRGLSNDVNRYISSTPFEDININDADLYTYISGIDAKGILFVDNFEKLSSKHWKYIVKNLEQFKPMIQEYMDKHIYQMNHYIENIDPTKEFSFVPEKGSKISSLAPRLLNGTFQFNAPLLMNFFRFSFIKIKEDIIGPILYEAIRKIDHPEVADLCGYIIDYCTRYNIIIPETAVLSLLEVKDNILMKYLMRYAGKCPYSDKIRDKAIEILKLDKNPDIFEMIQFGKSVSLVDIAFYLIAQQQFENYIYKHGTSKKSIIKITQTVQRFDVPLDTLTNIAEFVIENIEILGEKPKKLQRSLRLLRIVLSRIVDSKNQEKKEIMDELTAKLEKLTMITAGDSSMHNEIAGIFSESMKISAPTDKIINFIIESDSGLGAHSPYTADIFTIFCLGQSLTKASRYTMTLLFESQLRSEQVIAMRICLSMVSKTANNLAFNLFASILQNFLKAISPTPETESFYWPYPEIVSVIIHRIISHPRFNEVKDSFLKSALSSVIPPPSLAALSSLSAAFGDIILCLSPPQPLAGEYAEKFARYNTSHPNFSSICKPFTAWQLKYARNEEDATNIWLEAVNTNQKAFIARPCLQTAIDLADSVAARFDAEESAFLLVGKLALLDHPFLWTYLCIAMYLRRSTDDAGQSILKLAEDVADAMPSKERFEAIKNLCEEKVMKGALIASNC
ncbi:hypothetical protein TVAG_296960 [Trichomonas vaginalis G3]|uniref:Uncharacterized protein n=1 Tax=Trichomonas vaginalis (strain ATCC PRA-98 / G3) TaxID=412133 RepID=A2DR91_TRIV3|nr:armadillo (ARM) repeat-containing protein family [Trichomonas vaginalis G3]EAY17017.1 hypothetical protein TVAG_296960 [Trichomonas vaginalis G3]KAI5517882.1 armadillo (ARM) repeat-containing protein family [Trichomonas vaginalis G3]|eukprot:XP_001329240.1 hypothetical protein [Trichomonas vaginalis G3]